MSRHNSVYSGITFRVLSATRTTNTTSNVARQLAILILFDALPLIQMSIYEINATEEGTSMNIVHCDSEVNGKYK